MDETALNVTYHRAKEMLAQLSSFAPIRPHDDDYARVFVGEAATHARAGYAGLWASPPPWPIRPDQIEIHVTGATSEDFVADHPRARFFPGGYKEIAGLLVPGVLWLLWENVTPGQRDGITFDGLVDFGDRWAWFPKPWRVVQPAG